MRAYNSIRKADRSDRQTELILLTDRNQRILNNVTNRASVCA
jgi:hypothetical protein